jgi:hypothetical protein
VWEIMNEELNDYKIRKSGKRCDEKWRNLKKSYDKIKTESNKTGNRPHHWKFYDRMEEILKSSPQFHPVCIVSSTGAVTNSQPGPSNINKRNNNESENTNGSYKKKKTMNLKELDENKERRHQERMNQKREIFQWFQDYLQKKE